jgi:hypothetical protein
MPLPFASATDFAIVTLAAELVVVVAAQGGAALAGAQVPPAGGLAAAVFEMLVGAGVATVPLMRYVTALPGGNVGIVSSIAPVPFGFAQIAPPLGRHVHAEARMPAGSGSLTVVPSALELPVFVIVTVQLKVPPALYDGSSAVFVTAICGAEALLTVAVHGGAVLPGRHTPLDGITLAVLLTLAGGVADTVAVIV